MRATTTTEPAAALRPDPRLVRSRERVLAAALDLLREGGAAALTIEAVAARSGVAKTTIYRQFEDRDALHIATFEAIGSPEPVPATHDVRTDVLAFLRQFGHALRRADFGALLPTMIDAAERSERMAQLMCHATQRRCGLLQDRLLLARTRGDLPATTDVELLANQLVGPMFYRRFIAHQPISAAYIARLVDSLLPLPCR